MEELGYTQPKPTIMYEDNTAKSAAMYHKARHINTRVYHLCNLCQDGTMELEKIETTLQVADAFPKATPPSL